MLSAMFACLAYVLNTFVYFPAMAPFQHFVDVLAAVFVGPWYGCASAFLCGALRMMSGRTKKIYLAYVGEIIGTGICGALASYPLMKWFYGLDLQNWYYYIPFYTPAAVVGGAMGVAVLLLLRRSGVFRRMLSELNGGNDHV